MERGAMRKWLVEVVHRERCPSLETCVVISRNTEGYSVTFAVGYRMGELVETSIE
jgi:hypothetical protein